MQNPWKSFHVFNIDYIHNSNVYYQNGIKRKNFSINLQNADICRHLPTFTDNADIRRHLRWCRRTTTFVGVFHGGGPYMVKTRLLV